MYINGFNHSFNTLYFVTQCSSVSLTCWLWNKLPFGDNPFDWLTDWLRKAWFIYCESNHSKWTRRVEHLFLCMALLLLCSCVCVFKAWSVFPLWLCCIVQLVGRWFRGKGGWIHSWLHQLWPGPDVEQDLLERQAYSLRQTVIGLLEHADTLSTHPQYVGCIQSFPCGKRPIISISSCVFKLYQMSETHRTQVNECKCS